MLKVLQQKCCSYFVTVHRSWPLLCTAETAGSSIVAHFLGVSLDFPGAVFPNLFVDRLYIHGAKYWNICLHNTCYWTFNNWIFMKFSPKYKKKCCPEIGHKIVITPHKRGALEQIAENHTNNKFVNFVNSKWTGMFTGCGNFTKFNFKLGDYIWTRTIKVRHVIGAVPRHVLRDINNANTFAVRGLALAFPILEKHMWNGI